MNDNIYVLLINALGYLKKLVNYFTTPLPLSTQEGEAERKDLQRAGLAGDIFVVYMRQRTFRASA